MLAELTITVDAQVLVLASETQAQISVGGHPDSVSRNLLGDRRPVKLARLRLFLTGVAGLDCKVTSAPGV